MNGAVDYNNVGGESVSEDATELMVIDALKDAERKKKRSELNLLKTAASCKSLREQIASVNVTSGTSEDFLFASRLCDELHKRQSELKIKLMEYELDIEEIDDKYDAQLRSIKANGF